METPAPRRAFAVALGLVLVLSPFWLGALHAGEKRHVYRAVEVQPDGDHLSYPRYSEVEIGSQPSTTALEPHVYCVSDVRPECVLAGQLVGNGTARTELFADRSERPYFYHNYSLYELTVDRRREVVVFDAAPTTAAAMLDGIAQEPLEEGPRRRAVETGKATTFRELPPRFVRHDGSYYLVYEDGRTGHPLSARWLRGNTPQLLVLAGAFLLARGGRGNHGLDLPTGRDRD